jgi:hypothetical protein
MRRLISTALLLAVVPASAAMAAMTPYEARYDLTLLVASNTHGPRALDGVLEERVVRACTGWETRSRVMVNAVFRDGTASANERIFTSWEAENGKDYRFAVQTSKNGTMVEAFKGTAKLGKRGGNVTYEAVASGKKIKVPLPRDTFLPVAYVDALLSRASQGEVLFRGVLLNGSSSNGPRVLSTAIGPRATASGDASSDLDRGLLGEGWPMSLAFYNLFEQQRDTPIFETELRQHESGVADEIVQTFSDFTIAARLTHLKRLPQQACAKG